MAEHEAEHEQLRDLDAIGAAAVAEVSSATPDERLDCAGWPTAGELIAHLGNHFGWVLSAIGADARPPTGAGIPSGADPAAWFTRECARYLEQMRALPTDTPAWTLLGPGTLAFWRRRSLYEIGRHVWDLRTARDHRPPPPPEFSPARYADGVAEHFDVFLTRSRAQLDPLPGVLRLVATDHPASWVIAPDWSLESDLGADAVIEGPAGELALLCWERADALDSDQNALSVSGDRGVVRAFQTARIHR